MQPNDVTLRAEVAVIGAGIVGSALAAALIENGICTALIDEGSAGNQGASRYSGGIFRLFDRDEAISALAAYDLRCADSLVSRTMAATRRTTGMLYLGLSGCDATLHRCITQYADEGYPMRLLTPRELQAISAFPRPCSGEAVLFEPNAGVGNVRAAAGLLANQVKQHGLLLENMRVYSLRAIEDHVRLKVGNATLTARIVVIASGAWSASLLEDLPLATRSIPLVRLAASKPLSMPIIDAVADSYVVPLNGDLIHTGSRVRECVRFPEQLQWQSKEVIGKDALDRLSMITGTREDGPVVDILPGCDCYSPDGRPAVGFVDAARTRYVVTAMSGIGYKLASPLSNLVAKQIMQRLSGAAMATPELLAPFAPDRFRGPASREAMKGAR